MILLGMSISGVDVGDVGEVVVTAFSPVIVASLLKIDVVGGPVRFPTFGRSALASISELGLVADHLFIFFPFSLILQK